VSAGGAAVPHRQQDRQAVGQLDGALLEELTGDHADRQTRGHRNSVLAADEAGGVGDGAGPVVLLEDVGKTEVAVVQGAVAAVRERVGAGGSRELAGEHEASQVATVEQQQLLAVVLGLPAP